MNPCLAIAGIVLFIFAGCGSSSDLSNAETQRRFGIEMAKRDLWREAEFRFRRAVEIEPDNPMAHNNLAVALEANGDFDGALKEYREALRLDRSNQYIQKNYSRLVEFMQRGRKREPAATPAAKVPGTPAENAAPAAENKPPENPPDAVLPEGDR
jgi:Flp pilus assembly protein TadD